MSLLMKALDKAAKDREETDAGRTPAAPAGGAAAPGAGGAKSGLTLEPIAPQQATAPGAAPREPSLSPGKPAGAAPAAASRESDQAAIMIRASQRDAGGGVGAYVREHPLLVFGTLPALFLIGFGSYVYLQMTNPGLVVKQPPRPAQSAPNAPIVPAPAPAPAAGGGTLPAGQPPIPLTSLLPPLQAGAAREKPPSRPAAAGKTAAPEPPAAPETAPAPPAVRDTIKVTAGGAAPTINPLLAEAYAALNAGNLESSQQFYRQLLRSEPGNLDALLGLAAIATQQGNSEQASRHYLKVLELDPRHALAQAGLIGMLGRADPLAAESRLKQLIVRDPSAYLYFTLGNVFADQNRWPDAQQAYFQAHHLQPDNPDYAYNLAVGLEHIGQPKPALDFYRRALQLAAVKGRANFSTAAVQERTRKLEKAVQ
jgi:Tfp pilus assembly protein PilF